MQDAPHTPNNVSGHISKSNANLQSGSQPTNTVSLLGYGVDIFQSRFTPHGVDGFLKAPVLSISAEKTRVTACGQTTFHLPERAVFKRLNQQVIQHINSHSLLTLAKQLSTIGNDILSLGAFQQELKTAFSSFDTNPFVSNTYSLHQYSHAICSTTMPVYSRRELRTLARSEVIEVLDSYCEAPCNKQLKTMLFSLFNDYGTFICTGLLCGGVFRQETLLPQENYLASYSIDALAQAAYKEKAGMSLALNEAQALDFTDYNRHTHFSVRGGDPRFSKKIGTGHRHKRERAMHRWLQSLNEGKQLTFIDFTPNGLIPIWQLTRNPQDAPIIIQAFQQWYHHELVQRQLLPDVITQIGLIERDKPLDKNDTAGFSHRTDSMSQHDNRYLYLGYEKEPAHRVIKRKGSVVTQLHLAPWKKWSEQYQRINADKLSPNRLERVKNQYDQPGDLAPGLPHPQLGIRLDTRREQLSLENLVDCIQDIHITKGHYQWTASPINYKKLACNLGCPPDAPDHYYTYLSTLPMI